MIELKPQYANISQRVACSYIRSMAELTVAGMDEPLAASARELHAFFHALYQQVYDSPAEFGLPTAPDDCITGDESNGTQKKADLNSKMKKPREMIGAGLDFLLLAGQKGALAEDGCGLLLHPAEYTAFIGNSRNKKQFLKALGGVGLVIEEGGAGVVLTSPRYPRMFPALKALAEAAALCKDEHLAHYNFGRCDFRALDPNFKPTPADLFRVFNPADTARAARLDAYFAARGYKPILAINVFFEWDVQYQGKRSIKGSPLLHIGYSERYQNPLRVGIKCASTDRLLPLLPGRSRALQEDFSRRVFNCNGDACGWCKTRPHLGPSTYEFAGVTRTVCWFSIGDFTELNDQSEDLIHEYTEMHEALG